MSADHPRRSPAAARKALLLLIKGHDEEQKRFGLGCRLDPSIHLAMTRRILALLTGFAGTDLVIVQSGEVPPVPQARYLPERGVDFHQRYLNALRDTFALGYGRVVVVGGDIPSLCRRDIETALDRNGLAIGPTFDGGFYIAGLTPDDVPLFERLPWRHRSLLARLRERIAANGRDCHWLPCRRDVDDAESGRHVVSLLMRLLRQGLDGTRPDSWSLSFLLGLPDRPRPDPRYCCLAPPQL